MELPARMRKLLLLLWSKRTLVVVYRDPYRRTANRQPLRLPNGGQCIRHIIIIPNADLDKQFLELSNKAIRTS
jgi:hypothetical protein